ncbi:FxLYD domain-containing protein [Leptospira borgpetersenii]|uniref:FxLYD domain-containing protein n=1 Tax=Leptospira borgpetersenii TaxID=174 RepID=UPI000774AC63|nr:FxLYD domain-containing protein [Leptospira borgpetersenii]
MSVQFRIVIFFGKELLQNSTRIVIEVAPYVFFFFFSIPVLIWGRSNGEPTIDGKYKYYNVGLQDQFTYLEINGQIENLSGKDHAEAFFTMNFYDKDDILLETCQFAVQGFPSGHKRDFYASVKYVDPKRIKRFTIEFEGEN